MIKVDQLFFKYASETRYALEDISFEIPQGNYVAVVGHNGSGKSTLSKLLVALYKPTAGRIIIDDIVISKQTIKKIRAKIGIVFQNPDNQFIGATVEDDIAFGLENKLVPYEVMHAKVRELSHKVGMDKYLQFEPEKLSGGQKQRVAIASTLALDPEVMIFDEVTSMLDPKGKADVLAIIADIQKKRTKTLISITHDMDEALLADEVIVLANGKLVAQGPPREILVQEKIIEIAKIDNPFIYKLSSALKKTQVQPTFDKQNLLDQLCK